MFTAPTANPKWSEFSQFSRKKMGFLDIKIKNIFLRTRLNSFFN
jgi:hypothetical protein